MFIKAPWFILLLLIFLSFHSPAQFYNGSQLTFGKSRVQYTDFLWTYFRFDRFDTYFYQNGKELAQYTAEYADKHIKEIELNLQSNLEEKIQFIIFNSLTDLKQSNIGITGDWDYYNTGGVTRIIGGKVMLFFDGNYDHYDQQIRSGIAQVILNNMIYGTGIGAQIKNNALFTMPEWYMNGLISYVSRKWDPEIENFVRDAVLNGQYEKFNSLSGIEATYAGHALWNYIAMKFGPASIPNIVYMARLSRNVEKGFQYVVGFSFKSIVSEWLNFYKDIFSAQDIGKSNPAGKLLNPKKKPDRIYRGLKVSPDGNSVAYCTHELGVYKVFLQDLETGKKKKIYRGGYRLADRPDYSFPLAAWHPSGRILAILVERKGEPCLYLYNLEEKKFEHQILYNFDHILDMSYNDEGTLLVFSAIIKGQSDIFVYNIAAGSYEQITGDIYDDLNPRFINHSTEIIFSSNRPGDTIRFNQPLNIDKLTFSHDLFIYKYSARKNVLQRITRTRDASETQPQPYSGNYFAFLSEENGIVNRYLARFDSVIAFVDTTTHYRYVTSIIPVTNYSRNILEFDVSPKAAKIAEVVYQNRNYRMFVEDLILPNHVSKVELSPTYFKDYAARLTKNQKARQKADTLTPVMPEPVKSPEKKHFTSVRLSEIAPEIRQKGDTTDMASAQRPQPFSILNDTTGKGWLLGGGKAARKDTLNKYRNAKQLNYNVEYFIDQMVTQIDFTYLNFAYQPFTGSVTPDFINPGLNGLFMVGITDLMEDYRITGGLRVNFNLINNEYLFSFTHYRKRLDHQITFHRKAVEEIGMFALIRHKIHELYYTVTYPFNPVLNIKGTASIR
ncbi:MAG: hypothetical protein WCO93_12620, partial [bacterium]